MPGKFSTEPRGQSGPDPLQTTSEKLEFVASKHSAGNVTQSFNEIPLEMTKF